MLTFDSVKLRLDREQSLSYMEFNYMILQAYDFLELNKKENCVLQIGGSDQWGNIVNGVELIKRYSKYSSIIKKIEKVRTKNNANWMDLLRLCFYHDPKNAKKIVKQIFFQDKRINNLVRKLTK